MREKSSMGKVLCLVWLLLGSTGGEAGESVVTDSRGRTVTLAAPARRIVALAPHLTEMLFVAEAGQWIVGTVNYSDYPPEAQAIPQIGGYHQLDLEKIYALKPDLVVAWAGGNEKQEVQQLMDLGFPVFVSEPHRVTDIFQEIQTLSQLTDTREQIRSTLDRLSDEWKKLKETYAHRPPVRLFYQLWNAPLMTINRQHMIDDLISRCGGLNIFADLPTLIPKVGREAVIEANPEVIIASGMGQQRPEWLDGWRQWEGMRAVADNHLFFIPPDLIQRHSPRILQGAALLCDQLERVRSKRR